MNPLVISLGGSLLSTPQGVNVAYLKKFKEVIEEQLKTGRRIFIVVGGGSIAREYQKAAKDLGVTKDVDLDWIGIYATRFNAQVLRATLSEYAYEDVVCFPEDIPQSIPQLVIGAGGRPGGTTDGSSVKIANSIKATTIVNLTNIDYVYSADPKKDPGAKPLRSLTWDKYLKLIPQERKPGGNYPFDPVASRIAQEAGIQVVLMDGENVENFDAYLKGEEWKGTTLAGD